MSISEMRQEQLFSRETQCPPFYPRQMNGERRGGDEFIQSSGGMDLFIHPRPRRRPSATSQSASPGRHNNVKLGALFPRKYPTDGRTNRQPFYVNEKTENDAAVASPCLPPFPTHYSNIPTLFTIGHYRV